MALFSAIWGLCGDVDEKTKKTLDIFIKNIIFNGVVDESYNIYYEFGPYKEIETF